MNDRIAGTCPACGAVNTLFVGAGGHITCSLDKCLWPTAVADLLTPDSKILTSVTDLDRNNVTWVGELMKKRDSIHRRRGSRT